MGIMGLWGPYQGRYGYYVAKLPFGSRNLKTRTDFKSSSSGTGPRSFSALKRWDGKTVIRPTMLLV